MTDASSAPTTTHHLITGRTLLRRNIEAAIRAATMPVLVQDCDLEEVDLSGLDIGIFTFERCTFIKADLGHVRAVATVWRNCRSRQIRVSGADMTDAVFKGGDWNNADWTGAGLAGARFEGVKLTGGTFRAAKTLEVTFTDCPMQSCDLRGMSFRKARLGRCDMSGANIGGVDMREAAFAEGSSLAAAIMTDAAFGGADLRNVDLNGHGLGAIEILKGARLTVEQAARLVRNTGVIVG